MEKLAMRLEPGEALRIVNGSGLRLAVHAGSVWVTQEADRRDVVLEKGRWKRLDRDGVSIASASQTATVTVSAPLEIEPRWEIELVGPDGAVFRLQRARRSLARRIARGVLAWWITLHRYGAAAGRRFVQARRERAQAEMLASLDARTLKDIGLESYIDEQRRRERVRLVTARIGMF
jgi:hypothetical protein